MNILAAMETLHRTHRTSVKMIATFVRFSMWPRTTNHYYLKDAVNRLNEVAIKNEQVRQRDNE